MNVVYVILSVLGLIVLLYLLAALVAIFLVQMPLTRKCIINHFDKNLNEMYNEFNKKRYTSKDCNWQGKVTHYIKETVKCYCELVWRDVKKFISPKWHISSTNYLNKERNKEDNYSSDDSIPEFINKKSENESNKTPKVLHGVKHIISKAGKCKQLRLSNTQRSCLVHRLNEAFPAYII